MTIHRRQRLALPEEVTVLHRMKTIRTIGLAAVLGVMAAPGSPAEPPDTAVSAQPPHRIYGLAWSALEYPPLACPWGEGHSTRAELVLRDWPGQRCATNGFSLHLWLSQRYDGRTGVVSGSTAFPREGEIQCRLHRGDGTVAAAMNDPLTMGFMVGDLGTESGYVDCDLSWGTNEMDEAWIELQFPGYRYWLEVPYGFTHDSRNDRAARAPEPVRSALPTALAQRGTNDYVIPWQTYQCELDNRTDARVSLRWPRAEPATCTVELYRESGPWSPRSPVVAVDLRVPGQPLFSATRYSTTLPDEYRRDDAFRFDTAAWPRGRFRGEMHVMLDSRDYPVLLPGSVVGTGETATVSARLPPPWEPRAAPPDWPTITEALAAIQHQDRGLATGAEALRPIVAQAAKLLGADWPLVWSAMQRQRWDECQDCGCRPNDEHKVSLPPLRTATSNQPDFFLDCHVTATPSKTEPTRFRIDRLHAGFSTTLNAPWQKVIGEHWFATNGVMDLALRHAYVRTAAVERPVIGDMTVRCYPAREIIGTVYPDEFEVDLSFWPSQADRSVRTDVMLGFAHASKGTAVVPGSAAPPHIRSMQEWPPAGLLTDHFEIERPGLTHPREPRVQWAQAYGPGDLAVLPETTRALRLETNQFDDEDLAALARLPDLQTLDAGACERLTSDCLPHLRALPHLSELTLSGRRLSATGFEALTDLHELRRLAIHNSGALHGTNILNIARIDSLQELSLWWCPTLTDSDLSALAGMPRLQTLAFCGAEAITDEGLKSLSRLCGLRHLDLSHARQVTLKGLAYLAELPDLEELSLGFMPLDNDACVSLARIRSLRILTLRGLPIGRRGLDALQRLTKLDHAEFDRCSGVTDEGIRALRAAIY